jgi:CRISPR system CASCADE complex protein casC
MDNKRLFVDFHVIQTVPPSCINRDDTGSPKTAIYGGSRRARVSSQAWKHAMREYFKHELPEEDLASRTKYIRKKISEEIQKLRPHAGMDQCKEMAGLVFGQALSKNVAKKDKEKVKNKCNQEEQEALFFISLEQAKKLAALINEYANEKGELGEQDKKDLSQKAHEALRGNPSSEMLMFGRMVATDPSLNYDAAAQVAHSISTHAIHNEYDYFVAIDDLAPEESTGASHLGTTEFNSSTLYRYSTVNVMELAKWIENPEKIIKEFAKAFIYSMPTGKQNSFANRTLPDAIYITVREDQPVNLSGAFEEAIISRNGYSAPSIERLKEYVKKTYQNFVSEPLLTLGTGEMLGEICKIDRVEDTLLHLEDYVKNCLCEKGVQ